jgi:nucleoside-diphosphate-sugar epimerase
MTTPTNVLVTGGGGRLGAYVVDELVAHHAVRVADLKPPRRDVDFTRTDVLDLAALTAVMQGCDAVVHLAAIPNPRDKAAEVVFGINLLGTWNVLHAAHELGISKVVLCSSECATGLCYQSEDRPPLYLPVDEAHSLRPVDPYSLSKQMGEVAGQSFARRGMTVTVLRPTYILFPDEHDSIAERGRDPAHPDLWSYVEPEDVASAFRLALAHESAGFEVFFVSAADTISPTPTLDLVANRFGALPEVRNPALYEDNPHAAIYDIARTREVLGYAPESDWRRLVDRV